MISDCFLKQEMLLVNTIFQFSKNKNKSLLEPNFGFDLTRLACSLFDYFIPDMDKKINNPIAKIINEWVKDDNGKNLLYKSNGEERYPDFKLYKMITRKSKNHTPKAQLNREIFKKYICSKKKLAKEHRLSILIKYQNIFNFICLMLNI